MIAAGPPANPPDGHPEREIAARIRAEGPIAFDVFMELALYSEPGGYYQRDAEVLGPGGDYYTAPEATSAFGETLAVQIAECLGRLPQGTVDLVELGPGRGVLAADILRALERQDPGTYRRLTCWLVERSAKLRRLQEERLAPHSPRVRWVDGPEAVRDGAIQGCVVANEFYDALPVRVVARRAGSLYERRVDLAARAGGALSDAFRWTEVPLADEAVRAYAIRYGVAPNEGEEAEAGLASAAYARRVAKSLVKGFQIVLDYGDRAKGLYGSGSRTNGTLLSYRRHSATADVLSRPGEQDLTAHVNFSALEDAGASEGLATAGFTTQDRFLISLGLADRIAELSQATDPVRVQRRLAMMTLIHPERMGRAFRVLLQAKDADAGGLTGLSDPFAPGFARSGDR